MTRPRQRSKDVGIHGQSSHVRDVAQRSTNAQKRNHAATASYTFAGSGAECKYGRGYRVASDRASLMRYGINLLVDYGLYAEGESSDAANEPGQPHLQVQQSSPRVQPIELSHTPISQTPLPDLAGLQSPVSTGARLGPMPINDETQALTVSPSEESEIAEVNQHTNGIEFHGNTSSMSFLGSLQRLREQRAAPADPAGRKAFSLVSVLHNPSFVSRRNFTSDLTVALAATGFYSKRANTFIEGYFGGIHYVHPIIDKEDFLSRADQLWRGTDCSDVHFIALYLSVLSLGALTRTWNESTLDGLNRFQWSRKLFAEAQTVLDEIQFSSKLETIQSFYVMAKVCQNELNPNRQDEYHNRAMPPVDDSEYAIISAMVQFGRIMRKVSIGIYHSQLPTPETIGLACKIEREMDSWVDALPQRRGASLRDPDWRRKQRLVLELRYHNVRMLLFRPFVTQCARERLQPSDELMRAVEKCISSAQKTIEIVYEAYKVHTYFRTWWYNTTYITIAASVLLLYKSRTKERSPTSTLHLVETAIEILEVMDESIVARNAAEVIRHFVRELNTVPNRTSDDSMLDATSMANVQQAPTPGPWNSLDFGLTGFEFLDFPLGEMTAVFDELYKNLDHNAQPE
ncbi:hypothetical protein FLONG3_5731 [Fusarium longipes]|uniref:Xylanolytic transcriptional activator regulatory domain-containing protein n=1 Tax=Fusarium longipes TaxID=694270 RepID=A0A395SSA0_9HYPO|nr:hypothetical protein FLONG3_5731 [Fusarium longipes]